MRIALFTTNRTTIPPAPGIVAASAYLTGLLADELVERGHTVTLYAAKGSRSKASIVDLNMPPHELDYALEPKEWIKNMNLGMKQLYLAEVYQRASEFDVIHLQTEPVYLGMPFAKLTLTPTVVTNHNIFLEEEKPLLMAYSDVPIVTISRYQQSTMPELNHIGTVYDGIAINDYTYYSGDTNENYFYFMGRLVAAKGVGEAIDAATHSHSRLIINGVGTTAFIDQTIRPHLSQAIRFEEHVNKGSQKWMDLLGNARALLVPIQWEEPFGLILVEAMATGTPVIAFARGAVPEIVADGVTGFIVNPSDADKRGNWIIKEAGIPGLIEAMRRIQALSRPDYDAMRRASRKRVEEHFTASQMVDGYEAVYQEIVGKNC